MRSGLIIPAVALGLACQQQQLRPPQASHEVRASSSGSLADPGNGEAASPRLVPTLAPLAKQVTPAVVAIQSVFQPDSKRVVEGQQLPPGIPPGLLPPGFGQPEQQGPTRGLGSGFIVSSDGYILTNNHVVANASRVTVGLPDRRIFTAKVVGRDPSTEVALIKIDANNLPTLPLGDDSTVQVGDAVMAVGNPLGLNFTVTSGIISAKGRSGSLRDLFQPRYAVVDFLQTDAVVNPGNSGGPLVDMQGRVIGINTAIASSTGTYTGYSFAVPVSIARIIMDELRKDGHAHHAILGVSVQDVGPADAKVAGLSDIRGVLVGGLSDKSSPAAQAGMQAGDVITTINGREIDRVSTLQRLLLDFQPGQKISVEVQRFGKPQKFQVTLGEPPNESANVAAGRGGAGGMRLGIGVTPVTPDIAAQLQLPNTERGLIIEQVDPAGPAAGLLQPGDIITAALGPGAPQPIRTITDLHNAVQHAAKGVVSLQVYSAQAQSSRVVNIQLQ
jgi:serine protease Do